MNLGEDVAALAKRFLDNESVDDEDEHSGRDSVDNDDDILEHVRYSSVVSISDVNDDEQEVNDDDDDAGGEAVAPLTQSFACSSITELSSLCSVVEDDYDRRASHEIGKMLREIDTMLYDDDNPSTVVGNSFQQQMAEECGSWLSTFPHLRLLDARLAVTGKHVAVAAAVDSQDLEEEIIEQDGNVEELLAFDRLNLSPNEERTFKHQSSTHRLKRGLPPITPISCIRDNIVSAVFDNIFSAIWPSVRPFISRLRHLAELQRHNAHSSAAVSRRVHESWKMDALRLMQPPLNVGNLYREDSTSSDFSPVNTFASTPESGFHTMSSAHQSNYDKSMLISPIGGSSPGGNQSESSTLDGVLTVRSKALLAREKSNLTGHDALNDDTLSQASSFSPVSRPKSSFSVLPSSAAQILRATSAQRRISSYQRPRHLVPLQEEDRSRGPVQLPMSSIQYTVSSPSPTGRMQTSPNLISANNVVPAAATTVLPAAAAGYSAFSVQSILGPSPSSSVPGGSSNIHYSTAIVFSPSQNQAVIGQSLTASIAQVATAGFSTSGSAGAVIRTLLPPISHKRDASSANINRTLLPRKPAVHTTVVPYNKELRLLPGREREKSIVGPDPHYRPSTTHSIYRSETSCSTNRRPTASSSRHLANNAVATGTFSAHHGKNNVHLNLNVTGSSIAHPNDHTPDLTSNPRNAEMDLYDPGPLSTGLNMPQRRFQSHHNVALVR